MCFTSVSLFLRWSFSVSFSFTLFSLYAIFYANASYIAFQVLTYKNCWDASKRVPGVFILAPNPIFVSVIYLFIYFYTPVPLTFLRSQRPVQTPIRVHSPSYPLRSNPPSPPLLLLLRPGGSLFPPLSSALVCVPNAGLKRCTISDKHSKITTLFA